MKKHTRFLRAFTAALLLLCLTAAGVSTLTSCAAPKLSDVKAIFTDLIVRSETVNQILFGDGLSVYEQPLLHDKERGVYYVIYYTKAHGKLLAYYKPDVPSAQSDKGAGEGEGNGSGSGSGSGKPSSGRYQVLRFGVAGEGDPVYSDAEKGIWLCRSDLVYEESKKGLPEAPSGYGIVRDDERCTSMSEIAELARTVYSEDYLGHLFSFTMGDGNEIADFNSGTSLPKYREQKDEASGKKYLLRASASLCPPVVSETRRFDTESMQILRGSRSSYVTIELRTYGSYPDFDSGKVVVGWSTTRLSFAKENGEWRLDSPSY